MRIVQNLRGLLALSPFFVVCAASATPMPGSSFSYNASSSQTKYRTPEDIIPRIPVLSAIPRTFLFTGGYTVNLSVTEMRIDHMAPASHCPKKNRSCLLSLSYAQPVGEGLFSSRFEFPLVSAESIGSHWGTASFGDYVVHLSDTPMYSSAVKLLASACF